ncbi:efflux RND transporter periplasmic adaptor subunit [Methylacidimicrobium sp. B4]|uniref:efflux RND transporter periplasmic adaptor subunit n=1 Tax=Methylacidimicrobium sp. B4 TaxID=2796139 RepID=UPI001A8E52F3|nr:efflux RND transporter periplasmic adaptor subunit [Methylacidimicrobium sp. B4]QSR84150.1 efflux RND transporter periplasmic adaptor subunit [Methylacidimicrobium sp. B4]
MSSPEGLDGIGGGELPHKERPMLDDAVKRRSLAHHGGDEAIETREPDRMSESAGQAGFVGGANGAPSKGRGVRRFAVLFGGVLLLLFLIGLVPRFFNQISLRRAVVASEKIPVSVILPEKPKPESDLLLPGTARGYYETPIWARVNGYIKNWWVDIGERVQEGQLMAEIDAPDIDKSVEAYEGSLHQAEANLVIARITLDRWKGLILTRAVSQQALDEKQAMYDAALARVNAARGQLQHYEELQSFKKIIAPFSGIVTARNIDIGTLVSLGSDKAVHELYRVSVNDLMRVYVAVPQNYVPQIQLGTWADVTASELPGVIYHGLVVRTAQAVDPLSRTLLTEVDVGNPDGKIVVNMYVDVIFHLPTASTLLLVPVNAVVYRSDGTFLITVDKHSRVHYRKVELGHDLGNQMEIASGLRPDEKVILNPPESLEEGEEVLVASDLSKSKPRSERAETGEGKKHHASR